MLNWSQFSSRRPVLVLAKFAPLILFILFVAWQISPNILPQTIFSSVDERKIFFASIGQDPEKRVIALVTSWCPACKAMEERLNLKGIPFVRLDIEQSIQGRSLYDKAVQLTGQRGIPQMVVDNRWVGHSFSAVVAQLEKERGQ